MKWISVEDRLPEDGVDVLCVWKCGYWTGKQPRISVDRIQRHGDGIRDFQSDYIDCYTHWVLLPELPEVKE